MGHKAELSSSAQVEGDPTPKRSVFSSVLAMFRRAESKTKAHTNEKPVPAGKRLRQKAAAFQAPAVHRSPATGAEELQPPMSVKARAALFDSPPSTRDAREPARDRATPACALSDGVSEGQHRGSSAGKGSVTSKRATPPEVRRGADASDKEAERRDPGASPIFTVVADARAASSGRRARPPRSPSRGPPLTPEGAAERHRRTPLPAGSREVCRELQTLMALAESELAPRRLADMSPYATPQGSPMRSRRSHSGAGSVSGRSIVGSVSGRSMAGSPAGSRGGSVAGSRAGSVAGSRAGSVVGTPEKELLPPAPMLGASPGMIAAQMEAWKRAHAARAAVAREQASPLQGSASQTPRSVRRNSGRSVTFADDSESDSFGTPMQGKTSPIARPAPVGASPRAGQLVSSALVLRSLSGELTRST